MANQADQRTTNQHTELKDGRPEHAGRLDFVRAHRFATFGRAIRLSLRTEKWGKERVSRSAIGSIAVDAVELIDRCFAAVYRHSGPFDLDLRSFGWQPSSQNRPPENKA